MGSRCGTLLGRETPGKPDPEVFCRRTESTAKSPQENYSIEAPNFAEPAGELLLFRPGFLTGPFPSGALEESRNHPYQFSHVRSYRTSFTFQLPFGYKVAGLPAPEEMDLPFARYRSDITVEGDTLRYISIYEVKKLEVSANEVTSLRDFYNFVNRVARAVVVLERAN